MTQCVDPEDYYDPEDDEDSPLETHTITSALSSMELVNVFMCHYHRVFNRPGSMFSELKHGEEDETTLAMEMLYEEMHKFKIAEFEDRDVIYDPADVDAEQCDELYVLVIDDRQEKACKRLVPLLKYVATLQWMTIDWHIVPLITDN